MPVPNIPDHPRIRGEHVWLDVEWPKTFGSSPHTRGAQACIQERQNHRRIIPAYAGSTATCRVWRPRFGDHPRIRGEHPICVISAV